MNLPGMETETTSSLCLLSLVLYSAVLFWVHYCLPAVSDPGGPRPHRIQRQPKWEDRPIPLPASAAKWRCATAEQSHAITDSAFGESLLTGEPFGRDLWTPEPYNEKLKAVDEKLVSELASGGRSGHFNPSVNPNRYASKLRFVEYLLSILTCCRLTILITVLTYPTERN